MNGHFFLEGLRCGSRAWLPAIVAIGEAIRRLYSMVAQVSPEGGDQAGQNHDRCIAGGRTRPRWSACSGGVLREGV